MGLRNPDGDLFADDPFGRARAPEDPGPKLYSVAELTRAIKGALDRLGRVRVEGEISRVTRAASGHLYFELKDLDAKIDCKVWKSALSTALRFDLEEGMQVVAHGTLDVYAPRGTYSLIVSRIEQKGLGALLAELEKLKESLRAKGWFDRKRALPFLPRAVGVVTSRDGAALQDFLRTRSLRWADFPVVLVHAPVQGRGSAREIAAAIQRLDAIAAREGIDVICVVRGGGSIEDLWAFNELAVAEAVWNSSVPVISGVGHQTDTTLIDHVADHRAHTPTDAAQTAIPDRATLLSDLETSAANLEQVVGEILRRRADRMTQLGRSRALCDPRLSLELREARLEHHARALGLVASRAIASSRLALTRLEARLSRVSPLAAVNARAAHAPIAGARLVASVERVLRDRAQRLELARTRLETTSPFRVLARGYSITRRAGETKPLTNASGVKPGETIETLLADGTIASRVERADEAPRR